jgi:hypothetical protein
MNLPGWSCRIPALQPSRQLGPPLESAEKTYKLFEVILALVLCHVVLSRASKVQFLFTTVEPREERGRWRALLGARGTVAGRCAGVPRAERGG